MKKEKGVEAAAFCRLSHHTTILRYKMKKLQKAKP
jgi:hypothetical protein